MLSPRAGRAARWLVLRAALGGGGAVGLGGLGYAVLWAEAKLARRVVGVPRTSGPVCDGSYGSGAGEPLRLALLGDSSAVGLGVDTADEAPGALLATGLAEAAGRPVRLEVLAVSGAVSADLDAQVSRALLGAPQLAVIFIGANDVTHRIPAPTAVAHLGAAVRRLCTAGVEVLVATCPDLGAVRPIAQPLRLWARLRSRRLAARQTVAVVEAGGTTISIAGRLGPLFADEPGVFFSADRFHPSAAGYARVVELVLPAALEVAGLLPEPEGVRDVVESVELAAAEAAREPGAQVRPSGRLARLRRRVPLGRRDPAAR